MTNYSSGYVLRLVCFVSYEKTPNMPIDSLLDCFIYRVRIITKWYNQTVFNLKMYPAPYKSTSSFLVFRYNTNQSDFSMGTQSFFFHF